MSAGKPGRPPYIKSPEEFDGKVQEYVDKCTEEESPLTMTGLCLHMGFADRQSFYDYSKREGYKAVVCRARLLIENAYEKRLHTSQPSGAIFALKQWGWRDERSRGGSDLSPEEYALRAMAATKAMEALTTPAEPTGSEDG